MTKIFIDGREVEADPTQPLVHALHKEEEDVPVYCYHPGLTPVGSCRICQVEVKQGDMPARVVVACRTPISEGMQVFPHSPKAHEVRRECLEFLLKNHPLDCPICDKAGECDLQDFSFNEGQSFSRTVEPRRKLDKRKSLGDVILLDEERCILCSRCVRFMEEVPKSPQLTVSGLGANSTISTFMDRPLTGNYQGNLADICPVGALTLKSFRFQARVWNLKPTASTCGECSRGCSVFHEVLRSDELKRTRPRENSQVNGWWMCDTGRFAIDKHSLEGRLTGAHLHGKQGLKATKTEEALELATNMLALHGPPVLVASPWLTQEEGALFVELAQSLGTQAQFLSPAPNGLADDLLHTGDPAPNRRGLTELGLEPIESEALIENLAAAKSALLVGERIVDLIGEEQLQTLPAALRLIVCDLKSLEAPALNACFGIHSCVERRGTWINVDGQRGRISMCRPAPSGTLALEDLLRSLTSGARTPART